MHRAHGCLVLYSRYKCRWWVRYFYIFYIRINPESNGINIDITFLMGCLIFSLKRIKGRCFSV